jgi:hypothetical protein
MEKVNSSADPLQINSITDKLTILGLHLMELEWISSGFTWWLSVERVITVDSLKATEASYLIRN